jgi:DNA-binding beta-propeller fold protein YncE/mono/diheme cytochrome c family protein
MVLSLGHRLFRIVPLSVVLAVAAVVSPFCLMSASAAERPHGPIVVHASGDELVIGDRGGELIVVDPTTRAVRDRKRVGESLTDLKPLGDDRWLSSTSDGLQLMRREQQSWQTDDDLELLHIVDLTVHPNGRTVAAAGLWSRQVSLLTVENRKIQLATTIDLPFAPRSQCWFDDGQSLLVVDSFGGRFAILNVAGTIQRTGSMRVHNVRGLVADDREGQMYVSHQTMNPVATTERESIFWGGVIRSLYSRVSFAELVNAAEPILETVYPLSTPGDAAADPGPMVTLPDGGVAIALSGVGQLGVRLSGSGVLLRRNVGQRPQGVAFDAARREIYVVSTLSDRLSVLELDNPEAVHHIRFRETPDDLTSAERGERLFYDGRLSLDGWFSCHSCHTDGHANGQNNDNLGDGDFGRPKRVPSLLGVGESGPWAWNASKDHLSEQILGSVKTTMQGEGIDEQAAHDLAEYLRTLAPPPGLEKARGRMDKGQPEVGRRDAGERIFRRAGCVDCHAPPSYTTESVYDVGLTSVGEPVKFNPPSLRGVSQRDNLFHDGRANSLEEVINQYQHGQDNPLSEDDRASLLAFLRSL